MTTDKISFDITKGPKPRLNDFLLQASNVPIFPLLLLRFTPDTKHSTYDIEVKVGSKLYDLIRNSYGTDQLLLFQSSVNGEIGVWTFDILLSLQILSKLNILSDAKEWIVKSRASMAALLSKGKVESYTKNPKALNVSEDLLRAFGILEDVEKNTLLFRIVKDIIASKRMDADTIIYRVALSIYHSKNATNEAAIDKIEDPSTLYLNLSQSEFFESHADEFSPMTDMDTTARNIITKVVAVFSVAAYVYYKQTST